MSANEWILGSISSKTRPKLRNACSDFLVPVVRNCIACLSCVPAMEPVNPISVRAARAAVVSSKVNEKAAPAVPPNFIASANESILKREKFNASV